MAILFVAVTALWFAPWTSHVLFGDDLANYLAFRRGEFASSPWQALTASLYEKYRPVFQLVVGATFSLFGGNVDAHVAANMILAGVCAALVSVISFQLCANRAVAVLAGLMAAMSRFLLYQVTQVTGLVEGLGYALFLLMLLGLLWRDRTRAWPIGVALAAEWLLIFTHERYLPAAPWLAVVLFIARGEARLQIRAALAVAALAPALLYLTYKTGGLHEAVLVGTSGTHITLDVPATIERSRAAILSLVGFNTGTPYWIGTPIDLTSPLALAAAGIALSLTALVVNARWSPRAGVPASLGALAALLLIPAVSTIYLQQRWLLEPFVLMILISAWCVAESQSPRRSLIAFVGLAIASIIVDVGVSKGFTNIYFVASAKIAQNTKRAIVGDHPPPDVVLVAHPDICGWVLQNGSFFGFYRRGLKTECVSTPPAATAAKVFVAYPDYRVLPSS